MTAGLSILQGLSTIEKTRLRELSSVFLYQKRMTGVGISVTEEMRVTIAAQACLTILDLGIESMKGWYEIIIYPDIFYVSRDESDENGIIHHRNAVLSGEAWPRGPLILAWKAVMQDRVSLHEGQNLIIHEMAHKLDMLNGRANGMPPLHINMQTEHWTAVFSSAFQHLHQHIKHHRSVTINPYAASNPAEFFAVISEYFFSAPEILITHFPDVYHQLQLYYRQDPKCRYQTLS